MKKIDKKISGLVICLVVTVALMTIAISSSVSANSANEKNVNEPDSPVLVALNENGNAGTIGTQAVGLYNVRGKINFLRVHELGSGYGPSTDFIDVEVVIGLYGTPKKYGFQLRNDVKLPAHQGMLDLARDAFRDNRTVSMDVSIDPAKNNGIILRMMELR